LSHLRQVVTIRGIYVISRMGVNELPRTVCQNWCSDGRDCAEQALFLLE